MLRFLIMGALSAAILLAGAARADEPSAYDAYEEAKTLFHRGDYEAALAAGKRGLALTTKAAEADPALRLALLDLLAPASYRTRHLDDAERYLKQAIAARERKPGEERTLAIQLVNLGAVYGDQGRQRQAEPVLVRAVALQEKLFGPRNLELGLMLNNLGAAYDALGKRELATQSLERSAALIADLNPRHPNLYQALVNLGAIYSARRMPEQAASAYARALPLVTTQPDPEGAAASLASLHGRAQFDAGAYPDAEHTLKRALDSYEKRLRPDDPALVEHLDTYAAVLTVRGRPERAVPLYQRELAIRDKRDPLGDADTATNVANLAHALAASGRDSEAMTAYARAMLIRTRVLGAAHPDTVLVAREHGALQAKLRSSH